MGGPWFWVELASSPNYGFKLLTHSVNVHIYNPSLGETIECSLQLVRFGNVRE